MESAAVASTLNATLRLFQILYEFKAVDEQTGDLLQSTKHVSKTLDTVRELRRKKSQHLDSAEKGWIEDVLDSADKALKSVAKLIEPARVDMKTKHGKIGFRNRTVWVFKNSPQVQTNLAQLSIVNQSLASAMNILSAREGRLHIHGLTRALRHKSSHIRDDAAEPPPPYDENEFLAMRGRLRTSPGPATKLSYKEEIDSGIPRFNIDDKRTVQINVQGPDMKASTDFVLEVLPSPSPSENSTRGDIFAGACGSQISSDWSRLPPSGRYHNLEDLNGCTREQTQMEPLLGRGSEFGDRGQNDRRGPPPISTRGLYSPPCGAAMRRQSSGISSFCCDERDDVDYRMKDNNAPRTPFNEAEDSLSYRYSHRASRESIHQDNHMASTFSRLLTTDSQNPDYNVSDCYNNGFSSRSSSNLLTQSDRSIRHAPLRRQSPSIGDCRQTQLLPTRPSAGLGEHMMPFSMPHWHHQEGHSRRHKHHEKPLPTPPKLTGLARGDAWLEIQAGR